MTFVTQAMTVLVRWLNVSKYLFFVFDIMTLLLHVDMKYAMNVSHHTHLILKNMISNFFNLWYNQKNKLSILSNGLVNINRYLKLVFQYKFKNNRTTNII